MSRVERFEDLIAWQKARVLNREVYALTRDGPFARDFGLRTQAQRAAHSIVLNIAEGFERGGRGEFHQALSIAKGSCAEVRAVMYLALDLDYISRAQFDDIHATASEVARLVGGLRSAVQRQRDER